LVCVGKNANNFRFDLHKQYLPNKLALVVSQKLTIPLLIDKEPIEETKFYRCIDKSCGLPATNITTFLEQIIN
jgi:hypothetical protein